MNKIKKYAIYLPLFVIIASCSGVPKISFTKKADQIDVLADGRIITTYHFGPELPKPILYPAYSPSGVMMNRHYPLREGESKDHPHHTGMWFTYGEVNKTDFWVNRGTEKQIKQVDIKTETSPAGTGTIRADLIWQDENGRYLLKEERVMRFTAGPDEYTIDFSFKLTASETAVVFHDSKEGLFAFRVADWLREKEKGGTGRYLASTGAESEKNTWGKRAAWVRLEGQKDAKILGVCILNHPESVNYPTYWMNRGYGLFAANPLGQYVYDKHHKTGDPKHLNLTLKPGESALFKFRLVIYEGARDKAYWDEMHKAYGLVGA